MNEHLVAAVMYPALFFETSTDAECDLDLAVKELEGIAYQLRQLSSAEQDEFRRDAYRLADRDPSPYGRELRRLVDSLLPADDAD